MEVRSKHFKIISMTDLTDYFCILLGFFFHGSQTSGNDFLS